MVEQSLYKEYQEKYNNEKKDKPIVEYNGIDPKAKNELNYLWKSAKIGLLTAKDLAFSDAGIGDLIFTDEQLEKHKQDVIEARKERESFYIANKEDINGATMFLGGAVEGIINPVELGANILGYAVGGIVGGGATSVAIENIKSKRYEDKWLSPKENALVFGTSVALDLGGKYLSEGIKRMKSSILSNANVQGDVNINVRGAIDTVDDAFTYNGANRQVMQTNYPNEFIGSDAYRVKYGNEVTDPVQSFANKIYQSLKTPDELKWESLDQATRDELINVGAYDPTSFSDATNFNTYFQYNNWFTNTDVDIVPTFLDRQKLKMYFLEESVNKSKEFNPNINLSEVSGVKGFDKKTPIQKHVIIQNRENTLLDGLVNDTKPTVDDYYNRWTIAKNKNVNETPNITLNYEQIHNALNKIDGRFNTQKLYIQNEYMNIINKGDVEPMYLNQYINGFGDDNKNIASAWIKGFKDNGIDISVSGDRNNFLKTAYNDSVMLDEIGMKTSLFDMSDFENFNRKFGVSFDEYGDIKYDGSLFESLSKANADEKAVLTDAMRDNPEQYVEFIYNSKKILDGGQGTVANKELLNKANLELKDLTTQKNKYLNESIKDVADNIKDNYANSVDILKDKIKDTEIQIDNINASKVKGKKQKIQALKDIIDDLQAQIKNEDLDYKDKIKELKATKDTSSFDTQIKAKKEYIKKLKSIKESVKENDIKAFQEFFDKPYEEVKKYITKNKDFINSEYDKLINEVPIDKSTEPKIWKKSVATKLAKNKQELAKESIKINQTVNKQNMLGYIQKYYDNKVYRDTASTVNIKPEMKEDFIKEVLPFYQNGIFKLPEGLSRELDLTTDKNLKIIGKHFAEFIGEYKKTRSSAKVIGEYKTIGELREFFNDNQMSNFFIDYKNGDFLKSNAEIIRDIFDFNTAKISRFSEYGSTSPYVLANKIEYKLQDSFAKAYGNELSDAQKQVIKQIKKEANKMFEHTQFGRTSDISTVTYEASEKVRGVVSRGTLSFTGLPEFGQNPFLTLNKAQKYGGFRAYGETTKLMARDIKDYFTDNSTYYYRKVFRGQTSDNKLAKYNIAQMRKNVNFKKPSDKTGIAKGLEIYDDVAFKFQDLSQRQLNVYGESASTAILHKLPNDYRALENELKDVLRMNNITESNYGKFVEFTKNHIENNNLTVDMFKLSRQIEAGSLYADSLRSIHYKLTDYISNPKHNSKFNTVAQDTVSNWTGMFRSFSRAMNRDTYSRLLNYVDIDGVAKSRLSLNYIAPTDPSAYTNTVLGMLPTQVIKDVGYLSTGIMTLGIGGYGYTMGKELIQSDRTMKQRLSVMKNKSKQLAELYNNNDFIGIVSSYTELTGTNPIEYIQGTDMPTSIIKNINKIWETFTDEEKKAFGTNKEEALKEFSDTVLTYGLSRVGVNQVKAFYKYNTQGDVDSLGKVYGLDKQHQELYEADVRNKVYKENMEKRNEILLDHDLKVNQAEIDYSENNLSSFDNLKDKAKELGYTIIDNADVKDKEEFKQDFAIVYNNTNSAEETIEIMAENRPLDNIRVSDAINQYNNIEPKNDFEKLEPKKQDLFYLIMRFKGVEKPTQDDYKQYYDKIKNATSKDVRKILSDYDINYMRFLDLYNDEDVRVKAIKYYK